MKKDKIPYSANRKVCWEDGYNTAIEKEIEKNKKLRELYKIEIRKDLIEEFKRIIKKLNKNDLDLVDYILTDDLNKELDKIDNGI